MSSESRKASKSVTRGSRLALYGFSLTLNSIGTLPGPCTATSCPAAITTRGPATTGTAAAMVEIFRKSRRDTPGRSSTGSFGSIWTDLSSRIPVLRLAGTRRPPSPGYACSVDGWDQAEKLASTTLIIVNGNSAGTEVYNFAGPVWVRAVSNQQSALSRV